jgi:hypothetical protein
MAININIPSQVTEEIREGVTTTAPSEDTVFNALADKANSADLATVATTGDYDDLINKPTITSGTVTSVDLTMPAAFSVTGNPVTSSGTLAVAAAGLSSQYIRGDGQLANFPTSSGGGSSVNFYLNGSIDQGTLGGVAFKQMSNSPVIGTGTDFTINADGYIQSFITDASVPNQLSIPGGNWNFEMYFSASSNGGTPRFYLELYKLSAGTLTLLASSSANPEYITNGTQIDLYTTALAVPSTVLLAADRLAVRVYVIHSSKTIKLHTENGHLCQVITTFSTGLTALNGLTSQIQSFAVGTSGTDFAISSATDTHTFNLPTASASNRGALSSTDWSTFNGKQAALVSGTNIKTVNGNSLLGAGDITVGGGIAVGTTPVTSGTDTRVFFQQGGVVQQDSTFTFNNTLKRLTLKAVGTAATDIPLSISNSAGTGVLFQATGDGKHSFNMSPNTNFALSIDQTNQNGGISVYSSGQSIFTVAKIAGSVGYMGVSNNGNFSFFTGNTSYFNHSLVVGGNSTSPAARLDVRAQGALSTDIAFRVRNSADSADLISFRGDGSEWIQSVPFRHAGTLTGGTNALQSLYIGYNSVGLATSGTRNTIIGTGTGTTPSGISQTAIGHSVNTGGFSTAIAIGVGATLTSNNSCVMGSESFPFTSMAIGTGGLVTSAANIQNMNLFVGGISGGYGQNTSAASKYFRLSAQNGTGSGEGSPIQFATAPSGASGFSQNANVVFMEVRGDGMGLNHYQLSTPRIPSASLTDGYIQYSNDITAGNAAPHFRTENGNIIKLYQQSSSGITTVAQLVTVMQNLGLLS